MKRGKFIIVIKVEDVTISLVISKNIVDYTNKTL